MHLGCGDGALAIALRATDAYLVHGLDADPANVAKARARVLAAGQYGKVSIDRWNGRDLPYIDNLVNLIVVATDQGRVSREEILRVLCPGSKALLLNRKSQSANLQLQKPWPADIDEWTHYLHGADNNAVANDKVVGPPRHYQWIGSPRYLRHHDHLSGLSAMVSAKGRIFYIMDLGPRWSVQMPPKWTLVARDAFNGTVLWQRPISKWHAHLFCPTGFLDDSWWHRTYYMYGRSYVSAAGGWYLATYQAPAGRILSVDGAMVYGFGRAPLRLAGTPNSYHLFACHKEPELINPNPSRAPRKRGARIYGLVVRTRLKYQWSKSLPVMVRALVVAGDAVFAAGPPGVVDETEVYGN